MHYKSDVWQLRSRDSCLLQTSRKIFMRVGQVVAYNRRDGFPAELILRLSFQLHVRLWSMPQGNFRGGSFRLRWAFDDVLRNFICDLVIGRQRLVCKDGRILHCSKACYTICAVQVVLCYIIKALYLTGLMVFFYPHNLLGIIDGSKLTLLPNQKWSKITHEMS